MFALYLRYLILIILFSSSSLKLIAQTNTPVFNKEKILDSIYHIKVDENLSLQNIEKSMDSLYNIYKDPEILAFSKVIGYWFESQKTPEDLDKFKERVFIEFTAYPNLQARFYNNVGYINFMQFKNFERAFDAYLLLTDLLENHTNKEIYQYSYYCGQIASAYYKFKDYNTAIKYGKMGLPYAKDKWDMLNTIGLCYSALNKIDSSNIYLDEAIREAKRINKPSIYSSISKGNLGYNYYLTKQYDKAFPLFMEDFNAAFEYQDLGLAAGAAIHISDIYLKRGQLLKAKEFLETARDFISKSDQIERLEKIFPVYSDYYEKLGDLKKSLKYKDSSLWAYKYNDSVYNGLLVLRVQQRTDLNKIENEKLKLENYRDFVKIRIVSISAILFIMILGYVFYRNYQQKIIREKQKILELNRVLNLRQRLSSDMHDDIGSSLSSISIYTHSLLLQNQDTQHRKVLEKIKQSAQYVQGQVNDIIWSVNPEMDKMKELIARMRRFGAEMTESKAIKFNFVVSDGVENLDIEMSQRRHLYLMYKEVINNALKYSQAPKIDVSIFLKDSYLNICIKDNGVGFDFSKKSNGNGLLNLKNRAAQINGDLKIESNLYQGTEICIKFIPAINS